MRYHHQNCRWGTIKGENITESIQAETDKAAAHRELELWITDLRSRQRSSAA